MPKKENNIEKKKKAEIEKIEKKYQAKTVKKDRHVKGKNKHILCIVHKKNKSIRFLNVKTSVDYFKLDKNIYFIDPKGVYLDPKGFLCSSYLEGVSMPVDHSYFEYKTEKVKIHNEVTDKDEEHHLTFIKGLKLGSEVIYMILNQKLADMFTRIPLDMPNLILAILLLGNFIMSFIIIGVVWYFGG